METVSFADIAIVSCGTMSLELNYLRDEGFLDTSHILYTVPGLHQVVQELEHQLIKQINRAKEQTDKVIVVYGGKFCYVNIDQPMRTMQTIIEEQGEGVTRIEATHCMDMLVSESERNEIGNELADGEPVWWMTPGWIKYRQKVFKGWDKALANENFPRHSGGAIVLDGVGYMDMYMAEQPEDFLEYADWMGITLTPYPITLDRFKALLTDQARKLAG
ncbi:MAG: hypothetical protein BA862_08690 [Desulfobulbaceae bacterium S3730MH12]|nr:MAG: hypothetical protein BA866_07510 [Desulfobulbaceae bacterium S5133MH15]OEU55947.1 MAG: hypothetical protein BA862_08690 [Desulfobulbaceae bacterium S3730MH12]OEU82896.1 MAG: hypothetical protein BA873_16685 [Desulfobulbaceae bacterium C00003063]